ncbi:MAG: DUF1284 domain-containing protein [Candidatus Aenigmatarchaeota archaeon]
MWPVVYRIRGHHLADLACFIFNPDGLRRRRYFIENGYGEEFVDNQARIFSDIATGKTIMLIVTEPDDICLGNCRKKEKAEIPCDDPSGVGIDTRAANYFLLNVGRVYGFSEIEKNLRNFYMDQHMM